jgi:hypothetical protein
MDNIPEHLIWSACEKDHKQEELMNIVQTYHTIKERITRIRTMAWLQSGILHSRSVHLTRAASKMPGSAKKLSVADRFRCFLNNHLVSVRDWYRPTAEALLREAAQSGRPLRLLIDGSPIGNNHQLLMVSLGYRRRALPIAWTWVRCNRGHSSGRVQCALLAYVRQLVPPEAEVIVCGDSAFTPLQALLDSWGWFYALRQKGSHLFRKEDADAWPRGDSLVTKPGQCCWLSDIQLTKEHQHSCHFLALWQPGEKEPWLLATNLPDVRTTRLQYSRRMWTEAMFGDFKRHGFDLESSRLQHFLRLSRLTLAVSMLYVTVVAFGSQTIKMGLRHLIDRSDRRDSVFFGLGLICLNVALPTVTLSLSGSFPTFFETLR